MKLAWELINKPETLWVKVMRSKYRCGEEIIPKVRNIPKASNAWKGISQVWGRVKQNLIWRLENGQKVKFWKDHWQNSGELFGVSASAKTWTSNKLS